MFKKNIKAKKGGIAGRVPKRIYKDIKFDSYLEVFFYKLLEENNLVTKVELKKVFELQPSFQWFKNKIRRIDYESDFVFEDIKVLVETKGQLLEVAKLKYKLFKYKYPKYQFLMPRNQKECTEVIKQIKELYETQK